MKIMNDQGHANVDALAAYADSDPELAADDAMEIESHLATCSDCIGISRGLMAMAGARRVRQYAEQQRALSLASSATALVAAAGKAQYAEFRQRLARWSEKFAGRAEAVVRVVGKEADGVTRSLTRGLDALLVLKGGLAADGPRLGPVRGARRTSEGAVPTQGISPADGGQVYVSVRVLSTGIVVRVEGWPDGTPVPLVLVRAGDQPVALDEPTRTDGGVLEVEFPGVATEDFLVQLEPIDRGS